MLGKHIGYQYWLSVIVMLGKCIGYQYWLSVMVMLGKHMLGKKNSTVVQTLGSYSVCSKKGRDYVFIAIEIHCSCAGCKVKAQIICKFQWECRDCVLIAVYLQGLCGDCSGHAVLALTQQMLMAVDWLIVLIDPMKIFTYSYWINCNPIGAYLLCVYLYIVIVAVHG